MQCRSTILIACGWFLMVPPLNGKTVQDSAPMAKWTHVTSFDTARECENDRVLLGKSYKEQGKEVEERAIVMSRCIPTDSLPMK